MTSSQPISQPRSGFASVLTTFVVVLALTVAATVWWKQRSAPQVPQPPQVINLPAALATPEPAAPMLPAQATQATPTTTTATTMQAPAVRSEGPAVVPALTAWVVHAGQDIAVSGDNISLPSGAQFAIKLGSNVDGSLTFFTINPNGVSADKPLWTSEVKAGSTVAGPGLRLEGTKGLETLRLLLRPTAGGDEIEQHVQIWHQ